LALVLWQFKAANPQSQIQSNQSKADKRNNEDYR